jgi:hypothetical protein
MSEDYFPQYTARLDAVEALASALSGEPVDGRVATAGRSLKDLSVATDDQRTKTTYSDYADAMMAMGHLVRWTSAVRSAEVDADRFLRAAKQLARDIQRQAKERTTCVAHALARILAVGSPEDVDGVGRQLLTIALPFAKTGASSRAGVSKTSPQAAKSEDRQPIAFLSFRLDGAVFLDGRVVQADVLHDLDVQVQLSRWPTGAKRLHLVPMHVEPLGVLAAPDFVLEEPKESGAGLMMTSRGRLAVAVSQDFSARPIELVYVAFVEPDGPDTAVRVANQVLVQGQRQLVFESYDPRVNPVTGFVDVDVRLREMRREARGHGIPDSEVADLLTVAAAAGRIASQAIADDLYPGVWSEAQFQADVRSRLRMDRHIAAELEEHPHAAGGIVDLSYGHIRIELKAHDQGGVTIDTACERYGQQTSQYVAGSDRRSGALVVLDTETKKAAPGSVQNDIGIRAVAPPNGGREILLAVVIVRGNLSTPSALSG